MMMGDLQASRESCSHLVFVTACVNDNGSRFESPGTMHKQLTFSEFWGDSYQMEVSDKFVEYLSLCFRTCPYLVIIYSFNSRITAAAESHELYMLNPIQGVTDVPPRTTPAIPIPPSIAPGAQASSIPALIGLIRMAHKSRMITGPLPTRVDKRVLVSTASPANPPVPQVGTPDTSQVQTLNEVQQIRVDPPQATMLPPDTTQVGGECSEPDMFITKTPSLELTPLPTMETPDDGVSDSGSYTSTLPEIFDVGMDDSAPPATGPWMIIDHYTGEIIVDDNQSLPTPNTPVGLPGVEIAIAPQLGTPYLTETPPALLSEDEDVRPEWLLTAVNSFLRFVPCVGSLGKVIDLYLTQEARLGYPQMVRTLAYFFCSFCSDCLSLPASHSHLAIGPLRLPHL